MSKFFSNLLDNPIVKMLSFLVDLVVLNVMFLVTCIPIVTVGAALTSINYVCINGWDTHSAGIIKNYFKSFKQNFKQSTIAWIILLAVGALIGQMDYMAFSVWKDSRGFSVIMVVAVVLSILYACIFTYTWPLLAKFENTVSNTMKNALAMALSHLPSTLVCWAIVFIAATLVHEYILAKVLVVAVVFSVIAYIQGRIFHNVFAPFLD